MKKFVGILRCTEPKKAILKNAFILGAHLFLQQSLAISADLQIEEPSESMLPQAEELSDYDPTQSTTKFHQIKALGTIFNFVDSLIDENGADPSEILVVLDWDNTVSRVNGCSLPLREGLDTQNIINELVREGIPVAIMTARYRGDGIFSEENNDQIINQALAESVPKSALNMEKAMGFSLPNIFKETIENKVLKPGFSIGQYPYEFGNKDYHFLIHNSIIFAGGPSTTIKGLVLKILLEEKFLKKQPRYIIFVDNSLANVEGVLSTLPTSDLKYPKGVISTFLGSDIPAPHIGVIGLHFPEKEERDDYENCTLSP